MWPPIGQKKNHSALGAELATTEFQFVTLDGTYSSLNVECQDSI